MSVLFVLLRLRRDRPTLEIADFQDMGSHTPPEDLKARFQGAGGGYIHL